MQAAEVAVKYGIQLAGILAFWLGIMEIGRQSGIISKLAKKAKPLIGWLFPDIPSDHPAAAAILLNFIANLLGMGNAATPFGLKAMEHLADLDGHTGRASYSMCTLLAINTTGLTLIPTTVLGLRVAAGAADSTKVLTMITLTSFTSFIMAISLDRLFRRKSQQREGGSR
jgi:spore maturation protein A